MKDNNVNNNKMNDEIKLLIFDHDMTIVDSSYAITAALNMVADKVGRPRVTREDVMRCIALPIKDFLTELFGTWEPAWLEFYRDEVTPLEYKLIRPFPCVPEALSKLRSMGVSLAVASNRQDPRKAMDKSDTSRYFEAITGPGNGLSFKPAPDMLLHLMNKFHVGPKATAYVGDSDLDMQTATATGVRGIGVTTGNFGRAQLLMIGAWRVIDSIAELPALVSSTERTA